MCLSAKTKHTTREGITMDIIQDSSRIYKWNTLKKVSVLVSKALKKDALTRKRGVLMASCSDRIIYKIEESGALTYAGTWLCRDRLCPICAWRLSVRRVAEMIKTVAILAERYPDTKAVHVVLTVKNCSLDMLGITIRAMSEGFARLRRRTLWNDYIKGYVRSVEITRNKKTGEYHPHIHIVAIVPSFYTRQISIGDWQDLWMDCARLAYLPQVFASHAYTKKDIPEAKFKMIWDKANDTEGAAKKAIIEAVKYPMKPISLQSTAESGDLPEIAGQLQGIRLMSTGGIIKTIRRELGYSDTEPRTLDEVTINPNEGIDRYYLVYKWAGSIGEYVGELTMDISSHKE